MRKQQRCGQLPNTYLAHRIGALRAYVIRPLSFQYPENDESLSRNSLKDLSTVQFPIALTFGLTRKVWTVTAEIALVIQIDLPGPLEGWARTGISEGGGGGGC